MTDSTADDEVVRLTCWLTGRVQGVGMRWWVSSHAIDLGLSGWAANLADGRVEVVAEGSRRAGAALLAVLKGERRPGHVLSVTALWSEAEGGLTGFRQR